MILIRRNTWTREDLYWVAIILLYVNLVPYLSRVYRGVAWVAKYSRDSWIPDGGLFWMFVIGSLPAVPVVIAYRFRKTLPVTFIVSVIVVTAHLSYWHHDLELPMDALAAGFTMFMIPIRTLMYTTLVTAITLVAELVSRLLIRAMRKARGHHGY